MGSCNSGLPGELPAIQFRGSIGAAITIPAEKCLGKAMLLLVVEAAVKRLGGVCELLPRIRFVDLPVSILTHFVDQIDAALLRGVRISPGNLLFGLLLPRIHHCCFKSRSILLLLCSETQVGLHLGSAGRGLICDLARGQFCAVRTVARDRRPGDGRAGQQGCSRGENEGLSHNVFLFRI
jgi:hypothetical protein